MGNGSVEWNGIISGPRVYSEVICKNCWETAMRFVKGDYLSTCKIIFPTCYVYHEQKRGPSKEWWADSSMCERLANEVGIRAKGDQPPKYMFCGISKRDSLSIMYKKLFELGIKANRILGGASCCSMSQNNLMVFCEGMRGIKSLESSDDWFGREQHAYGLCEVVKEHIDGRFFVSREGRVALLSDRTSLTSLLKNLNIVRWMCGGFFGVEYLGDLIGGGFYYTLDRYDNAYYDKDVVTSYDSDSSGQEELRDYNFRRQKEERGKDSFCSWVDDCGKDKGDID